MDQAERSRVRKIRTPALLDHSTRTGPDSLPPIYQIYLDHAATTPLREEVLDAMMPWLTGHWGNPSSVHAPGRRARSAVEDARATVADVFGIEPGDVVFTSGGTESDNMAIRSARGSLAVSRTEHDAIVRTAEALEREGRTVLWMPSSPDGTIPAGSIDNAIDRGAGFVSVMHVNNETGAENDLEAASESCRRAGVPLHTDAVQSAGFYDLAELAGNADLVSLSAHKIGGPKGVGMLVRTSSSASPEPLITGGRQERDLRAGTENVAGIVGAARALELASTERRETAARIRGLRDGFRQRLVTTLGDAVRVNTPDTCAPHILSVILSDRHGRGLDGEMLVLGLDVEGLCVSTGSACSSGTVKPSRVLIEMNIAPDVARGAVRFSLGRGTTASQIERAADLVNRVVRRMAAS